MNKESDCTKEGVDSEQHLIKKSLAVLASNAAVDGASHRGWFVGHFLENIGGLRSTSAVEVKWGVYSAGAERTSWGLQRACDYALRIDQRERSDHFSSRSVSPLTRG